MSDGLRADKPSRYATSQLGQLSLPSLRGGGAENAGREIDGHANRPMTGHETARHRCSKIEYRPVWLELRRGVFTVQWQMSLAVYPPLHRVYT